MLAQPPSPERITASRGSLEPAAGSSTSGRSETSAASAGGEGAEAPSLARPASSGACQCSWLEKPCPTFVERHQLAAADARREVRRLLRVAHLVDVALQRDPGRGQLAPRARTGRPCRRAWAATPDRVPCRTAGAPRDPDRTRARSRRGTCWSAPAPARRTRASRRTSSRPGPARCSAAARASSARAATGPRARPPGRCTARSTSRRPSGSAPCRSRAPARPASASAWAMSTTPLRQPPSPDRNSTTCAGLVRGPDDRDRAEAAEREAARRLLGRGRRREREQQRREREPHRATTPLTPPEIKRRDVTQHERAARSRPARRGSAAPRPDRTCP